jgi:DedD protein
VENRVKERLTGAIILVAAMVILVPEMFSGHRAAPDAAVASPPRPATEGPPLRSYTMDRESQSSLRSAQPEAAPVPVEKAAPAPTAPPPVPAAAPVAVAVAPPRLPVPASAAPSAADEGFYVQVGSFSKADNAQRYAREISRKGFAARVDTGKGNLLRVRVGPVAGRAAALELKAQLAASGYEGALTAP